MRFERTSVFGASFAEDTVRQVLGDLEESSYVGFDAGRQALEGVAAFQC